MELVPGVSHIINESSTDRITSEVFVTLVLAAELIPVIPVAFTTWVDFPAPTFRIKMTYYILPAMFPESNG